MAGLFRLLFGLGCWVAASVAAQPSPLLRPSHAFSAADLAVVVNDNDPLSVKIADYYRQKRKIPQQQMLHVALPPGKTILSKTEFETVRAEVERQAPKHVQAYLLTWLKPFRVECMSITTAFAAGFNQDYCASGCQQTRGNPYFGSETDKPFDKYQLRPTMALSADSFEQAKAVIDRGVAADYSQPKGSAYLLKTHDQARSSRALAFPEIAEKLNPYWPVHYLEQEFIAGRNDVMFYFTGLTKVPHIAENRYLPGAVADHLTSAGGVMSGSDQMNVMEWLKAGVTGSYGAVVEPCNFPAKFPNPGVLMYFYLRGSSLIEAYWRSVQQPGQGIFVGEPLAKPFAYRPAATETK